MNIAIAGGTGLVGRALTEQLSKDGHNVYILTRGENKSLNSNITYVKWSPSNDIKLPQLEDIDVFINLAGDTINQRWTNKGKKSILKSRVVSTNAIANIITKMGNKPKVLIQASAVGYYGTSKKKVFYEDDKQTSSDFLATTVYQWEEAAKKIANLNVRTVLCRFGLILDGKAGALPTMVLPYRFFGGGKVGDGDQWVSWIHINDVVNAVIFAIENENISGPVNFTAPNPVTNDTLGRTISNVINMPHWFPIPSFVLKTILGEMSLLVLKGQKVLPKKLINNGFHFLYENIEDALLNIYQEKN